MGYKLSNCATLQKRYYQHFQATNLVGNVSIVGGLRESSILNNSFHGVPSITDCGAGSAQFQNWPYLKTVYYYCCCWIQAMCTAKGCGREFSAGVIRRSFLSTVTNKLAEIYQFCISVALIHLCAQKYNCPTVVTWTVMFRSISIWSSLCFSMKKMKNQRKEKGKPTDGSLRHVTPNCEKPLALSVSETASGLCK